MPLILKAAILALCASAQAAAPSAPFGRYFLAAGMGDPAYKDGDFGVAELHAPGAAAISKDGRFLYIADTGNDAIRRVDFAQRSRMDTLAGGPGKPETPAPSGLALSQDGAALFALVGQDGHLVRLPASGGPVQAYPSAVSTVAATALQAHPSLDRLFALNAHTRVLSVIELATGRVETLGFADGSLILDGGLTVSDQELYLLNRNGELVRLSLQGEGALAAVGMDSLKGKTVAVERIAYLGAGAKGMLAQGDELWVWDQGSGEFKRFRPASGSWSDYPLRDLDGRWMLRQLPYGRAPFADDMLPRSQDRPLLKGPLAFANDSAHGLFYAVEAQGNRVVGLQHPAWDQKREDGLPDYVNAAKAPGVTRILVLGDSMVLSYDAEAGEAPTVEGGFGKKLEFYLNAFASLKGKGRRFEVLQQSVPLGALGGGVTSYLANLPEPLKKLDADEFITLLTTMNINLELLGMTRTRCPDDICGAMVDPFFFDQKPAEMLENYGPLHRSFLKWLKDSGPPEIKEVMHLNPPGDRMDPGGAMYSTAELANSDYRGFVTKVHAKILAKALANAKRDKQRVIEVLLPMRNNLSPGENAVGGFSYSDHTLEAWMDADLERIAAEKGCDFINLTGPLRALEPMLFPLTASNVHHYTLKGMEWAAMATALAYVDRLP